MTGATLKCLGPLLVLAMVIVTVSGRPFACWTSLASGTFAFRSRSEGSVTVQPFVRRALYQSAASFQ